MDGIIVEWDDERGFGFIESPTAKQRVFVHISVFEATTRRPRVGDELSYVLAQDEQSRLKAIHASFLNPIHHSSNQSESPLDIKSILMLFVVALGVFLLILISSPIAWPFLAGILILSPVTFIAYGRDKVAAATGRWRTPETNLQLLSLLGGWPGAMIAQRRFRHKTRKSSFQITYFIMTLLNCSVVVFLATNPIHKTFPKIESTIQSKASEHSDSNVKAQKTLQLDFDSNEERNQQTEKDIEIRKDVEWDFDVEIRPALGTD